MDVIFIDFDIKFELKTPKILTLIENAPSRRADNFRGTFRMITFNEIIFVFQVIRAHRAVLAAGSKAFEKIFYELEQGIPPAKKRKPRSFSLISMHDE